MTLARLKLSKITDWRAVSLAQGSFLKPQKHQGLMSLGKEDFRNCDVTIAVRFIPGGESCICGPAGGGSQAFLFGGLGTQFILAALGCERRGRRP
jgi:hypothetical protein